MMECNRCYEINRLLEDNELLRNELNDREKEAVRINNLLVKKDKEWVLQTPDRVTLEKIHGLYNYEND